MGYLFSVKNNQVYFNQEAIGNTNNPSYFGVNNFIDGDLSLPATKENIGAVANAFTHLFMNAGGQFFNPDFLEDNRVGRLDVNYKYIKDGDPYKSGSGDKFSDDNTFQNVDNPTAGWCWFASGTLHRFFYKEFDLYKSVCKIHPNDFHWWLQDKSGNVIDLTEEQYLINGIKNIRDGVLRKPKTGEAKPQRPLRTSYALKTKNMAYFLVSYFTPFDVPMSRIKQHNYDK